MKFALAVFIAGITLATTGSTWWLYELGQQEELQHCEQVADGLSKCETVWVKKGTTEPAAGHGFWQFLMFAVGVSVAGSAVPRRLIL